MVTNLFDRIARTQYQQSQNTTVNWSRWTRRSRRPARERIWRSLSLGQGYSHYKQQDYCKESSKVFVSHTKIRFRGYNENNSILLQIYKIEQIYFRNQFTNLTFKSIQHKKDRNIIAYKRQKC